MRNKAKLHEFHGVLRFSTSFRPSSFLFGDKKTCQNAMEISEMPIWEPQTSSIPCERGLAKGVKNMQIQGDSDTCPKTNMDTQNVGFGNVSPASKMASFWVSMIKKCWGCMFFW